MFVSYLVKKDSFIVLLEVLILHIHFIKSNENEKQLQTPDRGACPIPTANSTPIICSYQ